MVRVIHGAVLTAASAMLLVIVYCILTASAHAGTNSDIQNVNRWKGEVIKYSRLYLPSLSPSLLAGQVHQESKGNPGARSPVGAMGLLQIMPATARDIARTCNLPEFDPFNPRHAIKGGICYDGQLLALIVKRLPAWSEIIKERADLVFRAYNGGAGWLIRESSYMQRRGVNGGSASQLSDVCVAAGRSSASCRENVDYPVRITRWSQLFYADWQ